MPVHHDEDLPAAFAILVAGMLAPAVVVAAAEGLLSLYLSQLKFVLIAVGIFGLMAWVLVERRGIDRTSFALVAIALPWPVLLAALFSILLLHRGEQIPSGPAADVFQYLIGSAERFFGYGALFALAGLGAAGLSRLVEARAERGDRVPDGATIATGATLALVVLVVIAAGVNLAAASTTSVTGVGPAVDAHGRPTLEVTLSGAPAELRLTAVAPDGTSVTQRLTRDDGRGPPVSVAVPVQPEEPASHGTLPALTGTYRIRLAALSGVTVGSATFEAAGTDVSLVSAQGASGGPTWDDPPDRVVGSVRHDTTVGVVLENGGSFHTPVSVAVGTADDARQVVARDVVAEPGERLGIVLSIPDDTVESIQSEADGTTTVGLYIGEPYGDPVAAVHLELPGA